MPYWEFGDAEGYELIRFTGSISTLELDEEFEPPWELDRLPFGFQAPVCAPALLDAPELTSEDWAEWLGSPPS